MQPEIHHHLCERQNQTQNEGGQKEMSKASGQALPNALINVVDLLIESRIRIDAMEQI
jgi:hypothetical protein